MATVDLTQAEFDNTLTNNDIVLIDFWAEWCGPCRAFGPIFKAASEKYPDIVFAKVNTEEERDLAIRFGIRSIPTLMIYRENILIYSKPGALQAPGLEDLIEQTKALDMNSVREEKARREQAAA